MKYCLFQKVTNNQLKWNHSELPDSITQFDFIENLKVIKNQKSLDIRLYFSEHYIIKETKKNEKKWLSYQNCVMTLVQENIEDQEMLGIRLKYQEDTFEIFGEVELLFNYMKPYVIQTNFQQKYVLTKKLGKGNFASVYQVRCKSSGNLFAAKVFEKQLLKNEVDIESLLKEISILRILNHEQVMKLFEVYETNNHICVIIEQLSGGTLQDYLDKNSPLTESQAAQLIYSLLKPVLHLHKLNVMHRDLKPENIIFKKQNTFDQLCLADFGLAEVFSKDQKNYLFTRCGTPGFVAPEVLHDKIYNCQIDMYSLGVILYGAVTGIYPFEGDYQARVIKNYKGEINFEGIKLSQIGLDFLKGLLEYYPEKRLTIKEALNHKWFKDEKITKLFEFKIRKSIQPLQQGIILHSPQLQKNMPLSARTQCSTGSPNSLTKSSVNNSLVKYSPVQTLVSKIKLSSQQLEEQPSPNSGRNSKLTPIHQSKNVLKVKQSLFKYSKPSFQE